MKKEFKYYTPILSGIMVLVFITQTLVSGFTDLFVLDSNSNFQIWRFVTAVFLHGGFGHLAYNLLALVLFGLMLEKFIGSRKFLIVFFVSGIVANLIAVNFYDSSLGASGAIFGIIGALIIIKPTLSVFAFGVPMPIFAAGFLWVLGDVVGAYSYFAGSALDNTGNIAHLSGIVVGIVFGLIWRDWSKAERRREVRIDERYMRNWEDFHLK